MSATKTKASRRTLRFTHLDEILADAQKLAGAGIQANGNWTASQVIGHVALAIHNSVHGFPFTAPLPFRIIGRLVRGIPLNKGLPSGIKIPGKAFDAVVPPADQPIDQAINKLTAAIDSAKAQQMKAPHPVFGKLNQAQWIKFHCRHAELHFSFLAPIGQTQHQDTSQRTPAAV
jgi:hypothetical protein